MRIAFIAYVLTMTSNVLAQSVPSGNGAASGRLTSVPGHTVARFGTAQTTGMYKAIQVDGLRLHHTSQYLPTDQTLDKDFVAQADDVIRSLRSDLSITGLDLDIVKLNIYVARAVDPGVIQGILLRQFPDHKPAVSLIETRLRQAKAMIAMDAVAAERLMPTTVLWSASRYSSFSGTLGPIASLPVGPRVYISGQAEKGADLTEATRKTLTSLHVTLKSLGCDFKHVIHVKCFLTPVSEVAQVERVIHEFIGKEFPTPCSFVEWQSSLPIEIELVAYIPTEADVGRKTPPQEPLEFITPPGMTASPVFCRVVRVNDPRTIFVSGLYSREPGDGAAQVNDVFAQLQDVLKASGSDLRHLAKATYYVGDAEVSAKLNELRPRFYDPQRPPAASKAQVFGVGPADRSLTLDMIAVPTK